MVAVMVVVGAWTWGLANQRGKRGLTSSDGSLSPVPGLCENQQRANQTLHRSERSGRFQLVRSLVPAQVTLVDR